MTIHPVSPAPDNSYAFVVRESGLRLVETATHLSKPMGRAVNRYMVLAALLSLLSLSYPSTALAINKCKDAEGNISFSDAPCPENNKSETVNLKGSGGESNGGLSSQWAGYCNATFTRDFTVKDVFGDVQLQVKKGSQYLLSGVTPLGFHSDTLLYPAKGGVIPYIFRYEKGARPYTTECNDNPGFVYGVLANTVLYADPRLTQEVCHLEAGTVLNGTSLFTPNMEGIAKFEHMGLHDRCSGYDTFYVKVVKTTVSGVTQFIMPFAFVRPR